MKKIISKLALVGVAVAALFTSCVVEDIQTTFDLADAVCTVNVKVLYALDQSEITTATAISHKYGSASTFTIPAKNKTVEAETLTISAEFKGLKDSQTLNIATLLPGGTAVYNVLFVFGGAEDLRYEARTVSSTDDEETIWLTNPHYTHGPDDGNWLYNDSEFILDGEVDYEIWSGCEIVSVNPDNDPNVNAFVNTIKTEVVTRTPAKLQFKVSAWARYRAWQTRRTTTVVKDVYKINTLLGTETKIGTFTYKQYSGNAAEEIEEENPSHAGHYQKGHGTVDTHGDHNNAGGGMFFGE